MNFEKGTELSASVELDLQYAVVRILTLFSSSLMQLFSDVASFQTFFLQLYLLGSIAIADYKSFRARFLPLVLQTDFGVVLALLSSTRFLHKIPHQFVKNICKRK